MLVFPRFTGDNSKELNNAQHHLYHYLIYNIFEKCKNTYLICDEVCNKLNKVERENLIQQTSFDHRTLQGTHDIIATAFRYVKRACTVTLFEPTTAEINTYFNRHYNDWSSDRLTEIELVWAYHWELFFNANIEDLSNVKSMRPEFVYNVINASVLNPNKKSGTESEHFLEKILISLLGLENAVKKI